MNEDILSKLYPPFAEKLRALLTALGPEWIVIDGLRSFQEQDAFYEQGRSRPGGVITRDRAGYSGHNYGTVAHVVPAINGQIQWDDNEGFLRMMVEAKKLGLATGGAWGDKFLEKSRVEMVILSMDESLALFKKDYLPAVWAAFDSQLGINKPAEVPPAEPASESVAEPEPEPDAAPEPEPEPEKAPAKKKAPRKSRK